MYQEIYKFAIKNKLVPLEHFSSKLISSYIILNENSEFIGIEVKDKKDKEKTLCPDIGSLAFSGSNCNPLVEKVKYIFNKNEKKHNGFLTIMDLGAKNDKYLNLINQFLIKYENDKELEEKIQTEITNLKIKDNSFISFKINEIDVVLEDSYKNWFISYMKDLTSKDENTQKTISLLSGNEVETISSTAPMIKNPGFLVGTGVYISSFNCDSFTSYGLKGNQNMPISEDEAKTLTAGLEYLLSNENHFNKDFGIIHYYDNNSSSLINELFNPLDDLFDDNISETTDDFSNKDILLKNTLNSIKDGTTPNKEIENDIFHIMSFKVPTQGRALLSNYKKGTCKDLQKNINQWKEDTTLISIDKINDNWMCQYKSIGKLYSIFYHLLQDNLAENKREQIDKEFGSEKLNLLFSIIDNNQIPYKLFQKAMFIVKRNMVKNERIDIIALKIIKAYLIREQRMKGEVSIMKELNTNESNLAYNCGRLFAMYEIVQKKAIKGLKSSIANSYFSTAQSSPALVFGKLSKMANYHINKLEDEGLKIYYINKINEITDNMTHFPQTLTLKEQGMFTLGYYHQRSDIYKPNKNTKNEESEGEE